LTSDEGAWLAVEMLRRIDMVVMYVRDWAPMLEWYQSRLGLEAVYVEPDHRFAVLGLPDGGPVLHLVGDERRELGSRNRCVANFAVDDFDDALRDFRDRGIKVLEVINDEEDGYRLARIADPEGNELNIYA
jgi:catechol 2,3-dioxygenase-like lactoylglutathione lyase family enzyme